MELTDEDIREFIGAWQEDFSEQISTAEARKHASALMQLCLLLERPLPEESLRQPHPCELLSLLSKIE